MIMKYLRARRGCILVFLLMAALCFIIIPLYSIVIEAAVYITMLASALLLAAALFDFPAFRRHMGQAERLAGMPDLGNTPPPAWAGPIERELFLAASATDRQCRGQLEECEAAQRQTSDYFAAWTHQIKTPIAAMSLLLQKDDSGRSRALKEQLFKTEQYVDMAMAYTRLDSPQNDFVIRRCAVDDALRAAARKYAPLFIGKGVRLDLRHTGLQALTDEKWLTFALEQIFSNAVKYTPSGGLVSVARGEGSTVIISDNGAGIPKEDLPRIWERGFTGYTGHGDSRSSGIGLYLTRTILERLGHTVSADSAPGKGTKIIVGLGSGKQPVE